MSILIKGMAMPKNCGECYFRIGRFCTRMNGYADNVESYVAEHIRHPLCPLVELPPHGRLIDADAFEYTCKISYCSGCEDYNGIKCKTCWVDDMLGELENATTIIESEGEDG